VLDQVEMIGVLESLRREAVAAVTALRELLGDLARDQELS